MKKNFLLLFLMALLPLAGWAQVDISEFQITINKDAHVYDGAAPAITVTVTSPSTLANLDGTDDYDVLYFTDKDDEEEDAVNGATLKDVGTYFLAAKGKGLYTGLTRKVQFNVTPKPITITFTAGQEKTYGTADPAEFTYGNLTSQLADGDAVADLGLTVGRVEGEDVSSYNFTAEITNKNYSLTVSTTNKFAIVEKDITTAGVTITPTNAVVTYNGNAQIPAYTIKYGDKDVTYEWAAFSDEDMTIGVDKSEVKDVATYYIKLTGTGNYAGSTTVAQSFKIDKAPMSVQIGDVTKTYKAANYAIGDLGTIPVTYLGFQGADVGSTTPAGLVGSSLSIGASCKDVGEYDITAVAGTCKNYELSIIKNGTFTIDPAPLTITASNKEKKVGEADPELTYIVSGIQDGESIADAIATAPTVTREAGETVGTFDINVTGGTAKSNYTIEHRVKGIFTITAGGIVVTVYNHKKTYGDADPDGLASPVRGVDYIVSGAADDDDVTVSALTYTGEDAGNYSLTATITAYDEENYDAPTIVPGTFTIEKKQLTFNLATQYIAIGDDKDDLSKKFVTVENYDGDATAIYDLDFDGVTVDGEGKTTENETKAYKATLKDDIWKNYAIITDDTTDPVTTDQTISGMLVVGTGTPGTALNLTSVDGDKAAFTAQDGKTCAVKISFAPRNGRDYGDGAADIEWKAAKWTTMVLPFDISVAELSQTLGYAIVNVIDATRTVIDGDGSKFYGKLTMTGGNGSNEVLKANKPFLVKIAGNMDPAENYNFGPRLIVVSDDTSVPADADGKCTFVGTYVNKTVTKDDEAAIWFMNGYEDGWQYIGSSSSATWTIRPFEAYIDMSNVPAASRNITFYAEEIDSTVTAIKGISVDENGRAKMNAEGWYNLNGMKLQGAPIQKGVYIYNGKKYVVK